MNIIRPYEKVQIKDLLNTNQIIKTDLLNKSWTNTIFPKSTKVQNQTYSKDNIITQIDDIYFNDFIILDKTEKTIIANDKRSLIKTKIYGDYIDSVKRYTHLNLPIDINSDAQKFLRIDKPNNKEKITGIAKHNDKNYIIQVLRWCKEKNIKYIYCITEHRPYIINQDYVTPYVYYTVKGY